MARLAREQPGSIDEAARALLEILSSEQKAELRAFEQNDLIHTHFGLGRFVRNHFGLWRSDCALMQAQPDSYPSRHPDSVASEIVERAWELLRSQDA